MKKVLPTLVLTSFLVMPALVFAVVQPPPIFETVEDLEAKIEYIGNVIFTILLAVAGIFLIISGFYFVTAGGNPEQLNKARQMLVNALIGVAVALAARGLVALIQSILV